MALIRRFPISFFLLVTVVITYVLGIAAYLPLKGIQTSLGTDFPGGNDLVMKFGSTLGGILTIGLLAGRKGLGDLFRRCMRWRFPPRLYVGAIHATRALTEAASERHTEQQLAGEGSEGRAEADGSGGFRSVPSQEERGEQNRRLDQPRNGIPHERMSGRGVRMTGPSDWEMCHEDQEHGQGRRDHRDRRRLGRHHGVGRR